MRMMRLVTASLCRKKRMRAYAHWLRASSSTPCSYVRSMLGLPTTDGSSGSATLPVASPALPGRATLADDMWSSSRSSGSMSAGRRVSVIAHSRIEHAIEDVRDEIEDDEHRRRDHQPCHDRVRIGAAERADEVEAHAVEREHRLRDDRATDEGAEVQGDHRHERHERVAERVAERHLAL